jgi:diphosphomevalonate decarboxylase
VNPTLFDENPRLRALAERLMQARREGRLTLQGGDCGYASAPSNIALLKYWGKQAGRKQIPVNSSISMTLGSFRAFTEVQVCGRFFPLQANSLPNTENRPAFLLELNGKETPLPAKMEQFLRHLLAPFGNDISLRVKSRNNFPTACGVASSAAGYAALVGAIADLLNLQRFFSDEELQIWQTEWARLGSGSATRSALSQAASAADENQFVAWHLSTGEHSTASPEPLTKTHACEANPRFADLRHCVLVLDSGEKKTDSSAGHELAQTSLLQEIRLAQYPFRFARMLDALRQGDFSCLAELTECDAFEMHAVMGTGATPLRYMNSQTARAIALFVRHRNEKQLPMFWTLDAGANPHLLYDGKSARELGSVFRQLSADPSFSSARVLLPLGRTPNHLVTGIDQLIKASLNSFQTGAQVELLKELSLAEAAEFLSK